MREFGAEHSPQFMKISALFRLFSECGDMVRPDQALGMRFVDDDSDA
jgi:hypothetical protein